MVKTPLGKVVEWICLPYRTVGTWGVRNHRCNSRVLCPFFFFYFSFLFLFHKCRAMLVYNFCVWNFPNEFRICRPLVFSKKSGLGWEPSMRWIDNTSWAQWYISLTSCLYWWRVEIWLGDWRATTYKFHRSEYWNRRVGKNPRSLLISDIL